MVTLVINPGSSSKKYAFFKDDTKLLSIRFEKTSEGFGRTTQLNAEQKRSEDIDVHMYREALHSVLGLAKSEGVIQSVDDIKTVAMRIVSPGSFFQTHRIVDERFIGRLVRAESILPLHIPPTLEEITAAKMLLPNAVMVGVSDSAFHATIPGKHASYSLRDAKSLDIKRFGYHGSSVRSVRAALPSVVENPGQRVVVAHIGSGVSVTALKGGESFYNSMGYTPASGVMMGSRAGDMDPGAIIEILKQTETKLTGGHRYLQTNGGFSGLLGVSDIRAVMARAGQGDHASREAFDIFLFNIRSQIATAVAALGGVDTLVLTATAVERNPDLREEILSGLEFLGVKIDQNTNINVHNEPGIISAAGSAVTVAIVPTSEMKEMATTAERVAQQAV